MDKKFISLSNCDSNGESDFVNVEDISLKFGNGGSWCRMDGKLANSYKLITVKYNGKIRYSWEPSSEELDKIRIDLERYNEMYPSSFRSNKIRLLKLYGIRNNKFKRPISSKIRNILKDKPCVSCGSLSNIEIDHKNGLYNDSEVLSVKTQKLYHFQPLCKHCNSQKRQTIVYTKNTNKRYKASFIPALSPLGIDFTCGDETFDYDDKNWAVGTYWYDPVEFMTLTTQRYS